jgi:DNA-binding XRE family transcriptional regulator
MIRTEAEYQEAIERLAEDRQVIALQRKALETKGTDAAGMDRVLAPALSFHAQLQDEVEAYEKMRRGEVAPIQSLAHIGRMLIGMRIALGVSQRDLAKRLEVSETQVSRDERNDYHGISVERAQRIIDALRGRVTVEAEIPDPDEGLVHA